MESLRVLTYDIPGDSAGRTADAVIISKQSPTGAWCAEWDEQMGDAVPFTDEGEEYISAPVGLTVYDSGPMSVSGPRARVVVKTTQSGNYHVHVQSLYDKPDVHYYLRELSFPCLLRANPGAWLFCIKPFRIVHAG